MPKLIRVTTVPLALQTLLAGQMRYMHENGFEVLMVSADGPGLDETIDNEGCPHKIIPMTRAITPFHDMISLWKLYRLFRKERPDIVHSHTPKAGLLAMLAAKYARVPVRIHTIAGLRFMTTKGMKRKVLIKMEKLTCSAAQYVWANSFSMKDYILEHKLCKPSKLSVIGKGSTNGINLKRFDRAVLDPVHVEAIKTKMKYDPSLFYFLFVGRLVKDKGIEELVEAFTKLHENNNQVRLVLVGALESELDPIAATTLEKINKHPAIIQMGWDSQTEYYFVMSNVFIFPSHREGFPNVLLQAGAMNCPVICSIIPGNIDVIKDAQTGMLFPVGDTNAIFEKMKWALTNPASLKQWSNNLEIKVRTDFSQIFVHQKINEQYRSYLLKTKTAFNN